MRKFLVLFATVALIVALVLPSAVEAKTKIKFQGDIRYRGWTMDGKDRDDKAADSQQAMDVRGRIKMTAQTSKDLQGVFWFEVGDELIGQDSTTTGEPGFRFDNDQKEIEVKQMYIDFKVPWNKALSFQIGAVPGYDLPKGILFGADAAGLKGKYEFKGGKIIAWYYKDKESVDIAADRDYMGAIAFYNVTKDIRVGAHVSYLNDRFGKIGGPSVTEAVDADDQTGISSEIWWYGATAAGKLPTQFPLKFSADVIVMDGERKIDPAISSTLAVKDLTGLAADVTLGTDIGPVYVEGFFTYASGDDNPSDDAEDLWRNVEGGKGNFRRMMLVHGYSGFDGGAFSDFNGDLLDDGYNGMIMFGGKAVYKPTSKLKLTGQVAYIQAAADASKYTSVYYSTGSFDRSAYSNNKDIGTELDLIADYKIYKQLNLRGVFAYMFSGDYFKETVETSGNTGAVDPGDMWFLGYNFTYKFK